MGMNPSPMTFEQIKYIMEQNPVIKTMIYTLIQNPMVMNQMMNIINVLNYNSLILNQIKSMMNQEKIMNNQMMNMMDMDNNEMLNQGNMYNNFKVKKVNENEVLNVFFRKRDHRPIRIQFNKKDRVSDAIKKYRIESGDQDEDIKFIFNARQLHPSRTLEESGMTEDGNIFVVVTSSVKGG